MKSVSISMLVILLSQWGQAVRIPDILSTFSAVFRTNEKCEPLTVPLCSRFGYNMTKMPNFLNHQTQDEARSELLGGYCKLIETECSAELPFLLCAYHFPICVPNLRYPVVPCKSLCRRVKKSCRPILERANYSWPSSLDCGALPSRSSEDEKGPLVVCVDDVADRAQDQAFCPAPVTVTPCPEPESCRLNRPKKKFLCRHYHGWAVHGRVTGETVSEGRHAYTVLVKKLLHTESDVLLSPGMFVRDAMGYFNLTVHTGQPTRCNKCSLLTVNSNKDIILAGELSSSAPHVMLSSPIATGGTAKASLLKKVPKQIRKCNKKHRAALAAA